MKIAVVGATGLVGQEMIRVLEERKVEVSTFYPVASERSIGKTCSFNGADYQVIGVDEAIDAAPDIAIFSAGASTSKKYALEFALCGTTVIDNSSAWRMNKEIPLVVPEINARILTAKDKIIANPNCSTIQLVMVLAPLHKAFGIKRVVVSTYQSVTGSGAAAAKQLEEERNNIKGKKAYPHNIDLNVIPEAGAMADNGYTTEEVKLLAESRKILGDNQLQLTATVVRVPVYGAHSEAVNIEFNEDYDLDEAVNILSKQPGVIIEDDIENHVYPTPLTAQGKDDVFVGRIRRDYSIASGLNLWVVSDNLRKGAATNAVQIAEYLISNKLVGR